jgi:ParB family chromosome partitioning protein
MLRHRFGLTVRFVEEPPASRDASPVVFVEGSGLGPNHPRHRQGLGSTSDQDIQTRVFRAGVLGCYAPNPSSVRRMVLSGTVWERRSARPALVGRDACIAAGMRIERELFDDNDDSRILGRCRRCSRASRRRRWKAAEARSPPSRSLAWVKPTLDPMPATIWSKGWSGLPNRHRSPRRNWRRLDKLDASYDEHAAILEDEDGAEEAVAAAEAAIEAIERECRKSVPDRQSSRGAQAEAGMILALSRDGAGSQPVFYGERQAEPTEADSGIEVVPADEGSDKRRTTLSKRLVDELAMQRRDVLALHVASDPGLALDIMVFTLADADTHDWRARLRPRCARLFRQGRSSASKPRMLRQQRARRAQVQSRRKLARWHRCDFPLRPVSRCPMTAAPLGLAMSLPGRSRRASTWPASVSCRSRTTSAA